MSWRKYLSNAINIVSNAAKTVSTGVIVSPEAVNWKQLGATVRNPNVIELGTGNTTYLPKNAQQAAAIYRNRRHVIFANDMSGSMDSRDARPKISFIKYNHDHRLGALYESCYEFLEKRANKDDIVSCVMYNGWAHVIMRNEPSDVNLVARYMLKREPGGSTSYVVALRGIENVLEQNPKEYIPVALFMTDGEMESDGCEAVLQRIMDTYHHSTGFTLHTIGIGDQVNEPLLRELARIGKGKFSKAKADLEDMKRVYATIANQLTIGQ